MRASQPPAGLLNPKKLKHQYRVPLASVESLAPTGFTTLAKSLIKCEDAYKILNMNIAIAGADISLLSNMFRPLS